MQNDNSQNLDITSEETNIIYVKMGFGAGTNAKNTFIKTDKISSCYILTLHTEQGRALFHIPHPIGMLMFDLSALPQKNIIFKN
jgi:hypothetical protein